MCGIVGVAGDLYNRDLDVFKNLLWIDTIRGWHNTGVASVGSNRKVDVCKVEGNPAFLFCKKEFDDMMHPQQKVLIGHNRHATVGSTEQKNAHPFEFDGVVGVHNGTLDGRSSAFLDMKKFGTDSEALYEAINELGVEETIKEIEGAWALVYYNKVDDTLNFIRNSKRSLSYAISAGGKQIYWASEGWMLREILNRHGVVLAQAGIMSLREDRLVSFKLPNGNAAFKEPTVTEVKGYTRPFFRQHVGGGHPLGSMLEKWGPEDGPSAEKSDDKQSSKSKKESAKKSGDPSNVVVFPSNDPYTGGDVNIAGGTELRGYLPTKDVLDRCYLLGERAGRAGRSVSSNPFEANTPHSHAWLRGRHNGFKKSLDLAFNGNTSTQLSGRTIRGFKGDLLDKASFHSLTNSTCSACDDVVEFGDAVTFISKNEFVCDNCAQGKPFQQMYGHMLD